MHKSERLQTVGWGKHKWKGSEQAASLVLRCNTEFHKEPFHHRDKITQRLACHTATNFVFSSLQGFKKGVVIWEGTVFQKTPIFCPRKCSASNSSLTIAWHVVPLHLEGMLLECGTLQNKRVALGMLQGGCVVHPLPCCMPTPCSSGRRCKATHHVCVQNPLERSIAQEARARTISCSQPASDRCFPHRKN